MRMSLSTSFSMPTSHGCDTKVRSRPLSHSGRLRAPWAPSILPQAPTSIGPFCRQRDLSLAQARCGFPTALADFRHIAFVLTESPAMIWALLHCLEWLTSLQLDGKLRSACDPCSIMARTEPPGRLPLLHRVPIPAAAHALAVLPASACGSLHRPFPSQVRRVLGADPVGPTLSTSPTSASRLPDEGMSLSTLFIAAVAQRRPEVCSQTPEPNRANSEPPGRRPPAPGSQPRRTHSVTGGPFASLDGLDVGRRSRLPSVTFHPRGNPRR